jgi:hypothetical protein
MVICFILGKMVCCVAPNCSNNTGMRAPNKVKISFFSFPFHPKFRQLWINHIRREKEWEPTRYSRLCSAHFNYDCFDVKPSESTGNRRLASLKVDAVLTIFKRDGPLKEERISTAVEKREKYKVNIFFFTYFISTCYIYVFIDSWNL